MSKALKGKVTHARHAHKETLPKSNTISAFVAFKAWLIAAPLYQFVAAYLLIVVIWSVLTQNSPFWLWLLGTLVATYWWIRALPWR